MEGFDINFVSKANDLRLYILDHTIQIEENISATLGNILNIEWQKSKSFGFSSSALTFNQKVQIVQDLKGLEKIEIQKLTDLMSIRNKFAHVKSIESFRDFFESGENGKNVKKNFEKWYSESLSHIEDEELKYKHYFFNLFLDIALLLWSIIVNHQLQENFKNETIISDKIHLQVLREELKRLPGGKFILNIAMDKALKKIKRK